MKYKYSNNKPLKYITVVNNNMSHEPTFMTDPSTVKIKKQKSNNNNSNVYVCLSEWTVNQSKEKHLKNYPVMRENWEILTLWQVILLQRTPSPKESGYIEF